MGFFFIDPETYHRYREQVLELSNAVQINLQEQLPADQRQRVWSDAEIAEKLGLEERAVREIRCVAERDKYGLDEFEEAIRFKDESCRAYAQKGLSSVMKPYVDAVRAAKDKS